MTAPAAALVIAQVQTPEEVEAVRELIREYTDWVFALARESEYAPTFHKLQQELATLPGVYAPPGGRLLLATYEGRPAGCIAIKPHDSMNAEVKRVYVRPEFRGLAIGQRLIAAVVKEARSMGLGRLILDSHVSMTKAHALYEAAGFRRTVAPPDFPEEMRPNAIFMEMELR